MGGRKPGTPNKISRERRELFDTFLNEEWENFKKMYTKADDATKLKIYMELIPYTTPKMATVEYEKKKAPKSYRDELDEDSGEITRS